MASRAKRSGHAWILRLAVVAVLIAVTAAIWCIDALSPGNEWFVDDTRYRREIAEAAGRHGVDPDLVRALIFHESRFDPHARGSAGEIGLMQVLPSGAAAEWSRVLKRPRPDEKELFDVRKNLDVGCWYLARSLRRWRNHKYALELALAQYNAGEARARRWSVGDGSVLDRITVASTKKYVEKITRRYRMYREQRPKEDEPKR